MVALLFVIGLIDLHSLVLIYAIAVSAKGAIMFFYLLFKGEINLKPNLGFIDKKMSKEMVSVALYSILTSIGGHLIFNFDKIIVNQMLGLSAAGIYTISSFFGTLVLLPSRSLLRISGTLIADAWRNDDVIYIADIYKRSCINQFIIAAFLFGGIWVNIDNILTILGNEYISGKLVILFIGIGTMIDMATGINGIIISYSRYYRMTLWFLMVQIAVFIAAMILFIPRWGITGAGFAVFVSFFINNLMRYIFLYRKIKLQPFSYRYLGVFLSFFSAYFAVSLIPEINMLWDILLRGILFALIYLSIVVLFSISKDLNLLLKGIIKQIKIIFTSIIQSF
jgi:O-antigen/teichoic acid export membrane protein